jgi:hypothetical protein
MFRKWFIKLFGSHLGISNFMLTHVHREYGRDENCSALIHYYPFKMTHGSANRFSLPQLYIEIELHETKTKE